MIIHYIYDGSFEGLLTAIFEAYYRREIPDRILSEHNLQEDLLARQVQIPSDPTKADRVFASIGTKISSQAQQNVLHCYLSDLKDAGTWIYHYLRLGWKTGSKVDLYLTDEKVQRVHQTARKVRFEAHRMLGLIRFRKLQGEIYYAPMEPDHNILGLIAPHFAQRMADQNWMIHDIRRGLAALYDQNEIKTAAILQKKELTLDQQELWYQQLWKQYFNSIAIPNRINPRLQRQHMPIRYWRHLIEK